MYRKTTLENGIRVVTESMSGMRSVAIGILVDASPQYEPVAQGGLAHLTEHLMFQGTRTRDALQIARVMDAAGGHIGAFTARDYTCFYATVLDDYRTYALELLGDILLNSLFPSDSLGREKEAILHELDASRDAPDKRVQTLLKASAWSAHPLGRPIIGHPESIKAILREDVLAFRHTYYVPDRLIVAAAGHVEHDDFASQVWDALWGMTGHSVQQATPAPQYHAGVTIEPAPVSQAYFAVGIPAYPYTHPDRYSLHVLNNVLGGGISSRLFCRLREERGLVYEISSEYHAYRNAGMLVIEGSTTPEHLLQVIGLTLVECWKLLTADEPVDAEELWKVKMQLRGQHLLAAEDTYTRMSRLVMQELYFGRHIPTEEILAHIETIGSQDIQHLADTFLLDALRQGTIAVVGPGAPEHYSVAAIEELLASF